MRLSLILCHHYRLINPPEQLYNSNDDDHPIATYAFASPVGAPNLAFMEVVSVSSWRTFVAFNNLVSRRCGKKILRSVQPFDCKIMLMGFPSSMSSISALQNLQLDALTFNSMAEMPNITSFTTNNPSNPFSCILLTDATGFFPRQKRTAAVTVAAANR